MAVAAIPAVIGAVGSVAGGVMGMSQANYQAEVAKQNAKIAQQNADRASVIGSIDAQMKDLEFSQLIGEQTSQQAASGVTVSGRSQLRTRNTSRLYAAADRQSIVENAGLENYNYRVEAANFKAQAKASQMEGKAALVNGLFGAAAGVGSAYADGAFKKSLVGGATSTAKVPIPKLRPLPPAPIPRVRPPQIGVNPLLRSKYNMGH